MVNLISLLAAGRFSTIKWPTIFGEDWPFELGEVQPNVQKVEINYDLLTFDLQKLMVSS